MKSLPVILLVFMVACGPAAASDSKRHAGHQHSTSGPQSLLETSTVLAMYGRGFKHEPALGLLGTKRSFGDVAESLDPYMQTIERNNGGKNVQIAIDLVYGVATICYPGFDCVSHLDDLGVNVIKDYIEPAAKLGWLVILHDQLGRNRPVAEVKRMMDKGYLRYDNVEVSLDPEYHAGLGQGTPGEPPGTILAAQVNRAQDLMSSYCLKQHLAHKKLLVIAQRTQAMLGRRSDLKNDSPCTDLVQLDTTAGTPGEKAHAYSTLVGPSAAGVKWRGLQLYYGSEFETTMRRDGPLMSWPQVFGQETVTDKDGKSYAVLPPPSLVVIG